MKDKNPPKLEKIPTLLFCTGDKVVFFCQSAHPEAHFNNISGYYMQSSFSCHMSQAWKQISASLWNPLDPRVETQLFPDDTRHLFNRELGQENPIFQSKW